MTESEKEAEVIAQFNFQDKYTKTKDLAKRPNYTIRLFDDETWEVTNSDDELMILQQGYWMKKEGCRFHTNTRDKDV